jgi:PAS domain S-box-containing protein
LYTTAQYSWQTLMLPALISIGFLISVDVYSWRHRGVPGAQWFAIACLMGIFWATGNLLELAAANLSAKLFWIKFQSIWPLAIATAMFCFILEYANLGRWLTRRTLTLLAIPPFLAFVLIFSNDFHHTFWLVSTYAEGRLPPPGIMAWIFLGYGDVLGLIGFLIFARLFVRSPEQRWPIVIVLIGQLITAVAFSLDNANLYLFSYQETYIPAYALTTGLFALALFGFHLFDPVRLAREQVIEQMRDGMLVLDPRQTIVDLNPAAGKILGKPVARLKGLPIQEAFPAQALAETCLDQSSWPAGSDPTRSEQKITSEVRLGAGDELKTYDLHLSPLKDDHGEARGCLILVRDATEQRQAQARLVEQQRALATLQERERLARELHDNLGQVLSYVSMQAQAIRKWVQSGEMALAETQLTHLANTAQEAHTDLRESILSLAISPTAQWSFLQALRQYLEAYQNNFGIQTELNCPAGLQEDLLEPEAGVQLLRVIQEALTNARKHGHPRRIQIDLQHLDGQARIIVADDGRGFDPAQQAIDANEHFGLAFMADRMAQIGGSLAIDSKPSVGTRVQLLAPVKSEKQPFGAPSLTG